MAWILVDSDRTDWSLKEAEQEVSKLLGDRYTVLTVTQTNNGEDIIQHIQNGGD